MFNLFKVKYKDNENFDSKIKDIKIFIDEGDFNIALKEIAKTEKIERSLFHKQVKLSGTKDLLNHYNNKILELKKLKQDALIGKKSNEKGFFNIFKKKEVDSKNIKEFKDALKAINVYMTLSEWEKAKKAIKEVEYKEKESLERLLNTFRADKSKETEKIKNQLIHDNTKKQEELKKLKEKLNKKENKYLKNDEEIRFKVKFKIIKDELKTLSGSNKNQEALDLLHNFLDENKDKTIVIKFFNKQKKNILKNIEKKKKITEKKIKHSAKIEAMNLIGQSLKVGNEKFNKKEERKNKKSLFKKIKEKFDFYKTLKEKAKRKKLFDEINMLIEEDSKVKQGMAEQKLANMHKGLIKEIKNHDILGYELYGKILGADKISGDTFGLYDNDDKYVFFLGDATGHGIRAGFIITLLSRLFNKYVKNKKINELIYKINNGLKQDLKSRNFITGIFFEIIKKHIGIINFVGMGHEPMLLYKSKKAKVEKIIPGGLAAGIRIMKSITNVKVSHIELDNNDILITYSDGIIEHKNEKGEFYGINRLMESFQRIASYSKDINKIYEYIINDIKTFKQKSSFDDDASILILKRNSDKDVQDDKSNYLKDLTLKEGLAKKDIKRLVGKNKEEIKEELEVIKKEKETKRVIKNLENLYYTGEVLKLKQEAKRYISEGFIDAKINKYLKIAIEKENEYKIEQKNNKMISKYNVLKELTKKGDYNTVIQEVENIISKDGNI